MFGIDFSELMVILVIALIVIGPERLPKVARTLGMLWARAQRYVNGVKSDIARDMAIEEFRQLQQKMQQEASSLEQSLKQASQKVDHEVRELNSVLARPTPVGQVAAPTRTQVPQEPTPQQAQLDLPTHPEQTSSEQKKFPVD